MTSLTVAAITLVAILGAPPLPGQAQRRARGAIVAEVKKPVTHIFVDGFSAISIDQKRYNLALLEPGGRRTSADRALHEGLQVAVAKGINARLTVRTGICLQKRCEVFVRLLLIDTEDGMVLSELQLPDLYEAGLHGEGCLDIWFQDLNKDHEVDFVYRRGLYGRGPRHLYKVEDPKVFVFTDSQFLPREIGDRSIVIDSEDYPSTERAP